MRGTELVTQRIWCGFVWRGVIKSRDWSDERGASVKGIDSMESHRGESCMALIREAAVEVVAGQGGAR